MKLLVWKVDYRLFFCFWSD